MDSMTTVSPARCFASLTRCGALAILAALGLSAGCAKKHCGYTFNRQRSINLSRPDKNWPCDSEKYLTPAEREIYELRGAPDLVRFWWKGGDEYARAIEVPMKIEPRDLATIPKSWIYLFQGDEVIFRSPITHEVKPINDRLQVVIEAGDPENRRFIPDPLGEIEEWQYYSRGMIYRFRDGELTGEPRRIHDPMGQYLRP